MSSVVSIILFGLIGAVLYYNHRLKQRARTLSAKVERALRNRSDAPIDFFKTTKARKSLGARSMVERLSEQMKTLRPDPDGKPIDLTWNLRSVADRLDQLEKEFGELNREKMKQKWGKPEARDV